VTICHLALATTTTTTGVRAIFWRGAGSILPEKYGAAPEKMNSRTNMIKQDETRKLDYIDCGKSLKNLYLHLHCPFSINIRKMLFFHFLAAGRKIARLPEKNYFARLLRDTPMVYPMCMSRQ